MKEKNNGLCSAGVAAIFVAALTIAGCGRGERPTAAADPGSQAAEPGPAAAPASVPAPPDVAAIPADAERSASGLAWKVLVPGTGSEHPGPTSTVEVHYSGWTTDGQMFDSSRVRGEPIKFRLNQVITGWTEGLQLMVAGEQRRFWIPPELAYKNSSRPGAPQGILVFDIELIAVQN